MHPYQIKPGRLFKQTSVGTEIQISPTKVNGYNSNQYFLVAFGLLNVLALTLFFCGLGFLAGLSVSKWQFPLAFISALIANYYASMFFMGEKVKGVFIKSSGAILGLLIGIILFSGLFYDTSYDGQWYHQETVYGLKQGYNPVYQKLSVPAEPLPVNDKSITQGATPVNLRSLNINNFGKGTEIIGAAIYQLTNRIETGKAVNGIMLVASFFLCLSLFYKIDRIGTRKKWLLAVLFSFNPVAITQVLSFCVDGNVACLLLCVLVISCLLFIQTNPYYLFLLGGIITIVINIKFTSLVFAGIYCAGFLIVLLVYKKRVAFKNVLITGIVSVVVGIFCCGVNPYITNLVKNHNVFYGLNETRKEIQQLTPSVFKTHNRYEDLFLSLATHQGWHAADKSSVRQIPKIPFTFNVEDIRDAGDPEQELSGFGPFFSGALLIVMMLFAITLIRFRKTEVFKYGISVFLITLATILIMPDLWWVRFIPQFWLLPLIILSIGEFVSMRGIRLLRGGLYLSLGLNIAWALLSVVFNVFTTARINYQMQQLQVLNRPVNVEYAMNKGFESNRLRFFETGVLITGKAISRPYVYNMVGSSTKFETPVALPALPKPFLVKLSERISGK